MPEELAAEVEVVGPARPEEIVGVKVVTGDIAPGKEVGAWTTPGEIEPGGKAGDTADETGPGEMELGAKELSEDARDQLARYGSGTNQAGGGVGAYHAAAGVR